MKRGLVIGIIVILGLVIILGGAFFLLEDECKNQSDNCYISKAMEKQDEKICNKLDDITSKEDCLIAVAGEKQDVEVCDKIGPRDKINACFRNVAVKKQDEFVCDQIEDKSAIEECYIYVAEEMGDGSLCEKISPDEDGRQSSTKDNCLMKVAIKINDWEMCHNIRGVWKENCFAKTEQQIP
ncbi:hypothetical protein CMI43_02335 [Candidatus Pacearchaeota archaeon]|jgi:hypothetical protein|nr:hypothetical protein [Candidatus Pacearchaeota archaeon]|tara:strand:+ start:30 stop:575 length:546 start_codon:yes stop_codon:yes gene_type:complete